MKKKIKKSDLKKYFPELYNWIYGADKPKKSLLKQVCLSCFFKWFVIEFNTILNNIYYSNLVKRANKLYSKNRDKTKTHRHVVPFTKTKCGIITGADMVTYNKRAIQEGLKKIKYNRLKKDAYYSTDTLKLSGTRKAKPELVIH